MKLTVIGLGKLGSPMYAVFASKGFFTVGLDLDKDKVAKIRSRVAPVEEDGLGRLLRCQSEGHTSHGWMEATTDFDDLMVRTSDAYFIVTATPSGPDGKFSLDYVLPVCEKLGKIIKDSDKFKLVVLTSTVTPGCTWGPIRKKLEEVSGKKAGVDFGLCYNPEFIALGTVIRDFTNPDLVLIGESDKRSGDILQGIYESVCENKPHYARMSPVNAEITKLSINTYLTTKITYANFLARLCEQIPGADVDVVTDAIGKDTRIGGKYLRGGLGYGGPCFPRDNFALQAVAQDVGVTADLPETVDRMNRWSTRWVASRIERYRIPERQETIAVLGLTYKPGTPIIEESPGIALAEELKRRGNTVITFDPEYKEGQSFPTVEETIRNADIVVVAMPWPKLLALETGKWSDGIPPAQASRCGRRLIDCWRALPHLRYEAQSDIWYIGLGLGEKDEM